MGGCFGKICGCFGNSVGGCFGNSVGGCFGNVWVGVLVKCVGVLVIVWVGVLVMCGWVFW